MIEVVSPVIVLYPSLSLSLSRARAYVCMCDCLWSARKKNVRTGIVLDKRGYKLTDIPIPVLFRGRSSFTGTLLLAQRLTTFLLINPVRFYRSPCLSTSTSILPRISNNSSLTAMKSDTFVHVPYMRRARTHRYLSSFRFYKMYRNNDQTKGYLRVF